MVTNVTSNPSDFPICQIIRAFPLHVLLILIGIWIFPVAMKMSVQRKLFGNFPMLAFNFPLYFAILEQEMGGDGVS